MMTKANILQEVKDYFFIAFGIFIYAAGVTIFMLPYGLTSGGVSGVSAIIFYATGFEIQNTYIIINVCLLIAAVKVLGFKFCLKTIYGVFAMTLFLWLLQRLIEIPDPAVPGSYVLPKLVGPEAHFMACVLGAITEGIGLSFCFEHNGSTGGTDIVAAIVNKYHNMSLGTVLMFCDLIIISSCYFIFHDWFRVIYGYVMLFICSFTLDYCMNRRHQSVQFLIFSRNPESIANAITQSHRGVTVLDGEGWYTHTERKVLLSIVRKREQTTMLRLIKSIDPYAFVSMSNAGGVWGEGFDKIKVSESKKQKSKRLLVFASNSQHKLAEVRAILGDKYEIRSLADIGCYIDIPEQAGSIQGNALLKARFVKRYFGFDCIADDTALECKALNGLPGIYSSTYAAVSEPLPPADTAMQHTMEVYNEEVSQEMFRILHSQNKKVQKPADYNPKANIEKLLLNLKGKDRTAELHTVVAFITGDYDDPAKCDTHTFDGILEGSIAEEPYGDPAQTFFYDSVFIPKGQDKTYQELGIDVKNQISQRAIAVGKLKTFLETVPLKAEK